MLKTQVQQTAAHPLEPLSKAEVEAVVEIVKADSRVSDGFRFVTVMLNEPDKQVVLNYKPGAEFEREAFVVLLDRVSGVCVEAVEDS
jgi:primary-amine oxidase